MRGYLVKASPDMSAREALDMFDLYQTPALPVVDDEGRLIGVVSERDLMDRLAPARWRQDEASGDAAETAESAASIRDSFAAICVRDCMTAPAVAVEQTADIEEAGRIVAERGIKRLPVIDEQGRLVGMLTRGDILQAIVEGDIR
jgi:CBS domain-containing protein